jgi:hypothetical protein
MLTTPRLIACVILLAAAIDSSRQTSAPVRVGLIGLDTSHSPAFTKILNDPQAAEDVAGFRVTMAYPYGSRTIESRYSRIPTFTEEVRQLGVEIVDSVAEVLRRADVVLLMTNDGRLQPRAGAAGVPGGQAGLHRQAARGDARRRGRGLRGCTTVWRAGVLELVVAVRRRRASRPARIARAHRRGRCVLAGDARAHAPGPLLVRHSWGGTAVHGSRYWMRGGRPGAYGGHRRRHRALDGRPDWHRPRHSRRPHRLRRHRVRR